jgi:hypothetical protein
VAAYVPLYWWRKLSDKRLGITDEDEMPLVVGSPGGIDLAGMAPPHLATEGDVAAMPSLSTMTDTEL